MITRFLGMTAGMICLAGPTVAQSGQCAPRELVVERLAEAYGETRRSVGLAGGNAIMEVFASEASGSWTITVTDARGVTCLIAAGRAYEALAGERPAPGNDA